MRRRTAMLWLIGYGQFNRASIGYEPNFQSISRYILFDPTVSRRKKRASPHNFRRGVFATFSPGSHAITGSFSWTAFKVSVLHPPAQSDIPYSTMSGSIQPDGEQF